MRIRGNAVSYLRCGGGRRQEQEVCARCNKPLALGASKLSQNGKISVFLVAAVAVDLAADFTTGPPGAVNVDVSFSCTYRREQLVKFSGADATLIREVCNIHCRDGA